MTSGFLPAVPLAGSVLEAGAVAEEPVCTQGSSLFERTLQEADAALRHFLLRHLRNPDLAADAAQETHLRMLRYRALGDAGEIRALLFRVAGSVMNDQYRRARTHQADEHCTFDGLELPSPEPAPERVVQGRQDLASVKLAIRSLPPRCREVFLLHRFEGMSYKDIARHFGTSERTVENQVAKALAVCRAAIGEGRR